jgi:hypothetical protein
MPARLSAYLPPKPRLFRLVAVLGYSKPNCDDYDVACRINKRTAEKAPILIGTVRRTADDLDEIAVRLERKSRYAEKGLLIEHERSGDGWASRSKSHVYSEPGRAGCTR